MDLICDASGNLHKAIYLNKALNQYLCWHDLTQLDKNWHKRLIADLLKDKERERKSKIPTQDLYIFDDVKLDG